MCKKYILIFILISLNVNAQIKAITEKNDTILVFENGTWEKIKKYKENVNLKSDIVVKLEIDEFDKSKKVTTEVWSKFGKSKQGATLSGSLIKFNDIIGFSITFSGDLGCLSEKNSSMLVKLNNGTVIEFVQISNTDCSDYPTVKFIPLKREELKDPNYKNIIQQNIELLKQYDWETIRISGTKYYIDILPSSSRKIEKPEQFFRLHITAAETK